MHYQVNSQCTYNNALPLAFDYNMGYSAFHEVGGEINYDQLGQAPMLIHMQSHLNILYIKPAWQLCVCVCVCVITSLEQ